jgi:hypothetical protein
MRSNPRSRKFIIITLTVSMLVILLALATQYALAKRSEASIIQEPTSNSPSGYGDDGIFEVGVEWMNIFPNPADNRSYWDVSCDGLYNSLVGKGWKPRFHYVNYSAWETDAKDESLGGHEDIYFDSVDLGMICTHGGAVYYTDLQKTIRTVFYGSSHDDQHLSPLEVYMAYGEKDLEYLAFDSCSVLDDTTFIYWASTFNGLHLLLSFLNNMHVDPYGDGLLWGYFMTSAYASTVTQAWFSAIDYNQPSDTCARIIGEKASNYNEHWWNTSPDPVVDSEKVIWDHCSHSFIYGRLNNQQTEVATIPVVQVIPRVVNKDYILNNIAPAFNMTGPIGRDEMFIYMADITDGITRTLLIDPVTGSYSYHNLSKLWTSPDVAPDLPDVKMALTYVNAWFSATPAKGLPGATYRNASFIYDPESIVSLLLAQTENGDLQGEQTSSMPTDISMTFPRKITVEAGTANGIQQVDFPIFGPGARLVVYLGDGGEIIGAQGGSRDVQVRSQQVTILDPNVVWSMFLANPNLSIGESPMADTITHTVPTLGYYEMPYMAEQDDLIPVWEFRSWFYSEGNLIAEDMPVYLPAASDYMPPQVSILNPPDGSTFSAGEPISFNGSVTGGSPPYTYEWTSSSDGHLGDTLNIVAAIGSEVRSSTIFHPTVSLQVTDANGLTSTATITLAIKPIFWLPLMTK